MCLDESWSNTALIRALRTRLAADVLGELFILLAGNGRGVRKNPRRCSVLGGGTVTFINHFRILEP